MRQIRWWLLIFCIYITSTQAQNSTAESKADENRVKEIVRFLEYMLNTLGSNATPASDKEVVINESFSKIFRDGKVQIDDDLDPRRSVITNKDVQAYLKDVDFFFTNVKFDFTVEAIERQRNINDQLFYKVTLTRNLRGTTSECTPIQNTMERFIEMNYNINEQDLKIVSIYTHEFDLKEELTHWWSSLSLGWKSIFKHELRNRNKTIDGHSGFEDESDSLSLEDIKSVMAIRQFNLSNNPYIDNIEPLSKIAGLRQLDLSKTDIHDLSPIRNLTALIELDISHTNVTDLSALRYASSIEKLNLEQTPISDISVVENMDGLKHLNISGTMIRDLSPVSNLGQLRSLRFAHTKVTSLSGLETLAHLETFDASSTSIGDIAPLQHMTRLVHLKLDSTNVTRLDPLRSLKNLKVVSLNHTNVSSIDMLHSIDSLKRVYCDQTRVGVDEAQSLTSKRSGVLVVFDSKDLRTWWLTLADGWKKAFVSVAHTTLQPSDEELARITNIDSVYLRPDTLIVTLEPLRRLRKLKVLIAAGTGIDNLSTLKENRELVRIDISSTSVRDIQVLTHLPELTTVNADNTEIQNIMPLASHQRLQVLSVNHTGVSEFHVQEFLRENRRCLVIYKSNYLKRWWDALPEFWKQMLKDQSFPGDEPTTINLHRLVESKSIKIADSRVHDLTPLKAFVLPENLEISGTAVSDLSPIGEFTSLKSLTITESPVDDATPLRTLTSLEELNISRTAINDLRPLSNLTQLKSLDCSGTQIRRLDGLTHLGKLKKLDFSNTHVRRIDPVLYLPLKDMKCYNTRVWRRSIDDFRQINPECSVIYYK